MFESETNTETQLSLEPLLGLDDDVANNLADELQTFLEARFSRRKFVKYGFLVFAGLAIFHDIERFINDSPTIKFDINRIKEVWPMGNSLAMGYGGLEVPSRLDDSQILTYYMNAYADGKIIGWIDDLTNMLNQKAGHKVANFHARQDFLMGGMLSRQLLQRVSSREAQLLLKEVDDLVCCLSIGPDDIFQLFNIITGTHGNFSLFAAIDSFKTFMSNLNQSMYRIKAGSPSAEIMIITIPDLLEVPAIRQQLQGKAGVKRLLGLYLKLFNVGIRLVAKQYNASVVSLNGVPIHDSEVYIDGLHPNSKGYRKIARVAEGKVEIVYR